MGSQTLMLGLDDLYTYVSHDHGGGTTSHVNLATANTVTQHHSGSIPAKRATGQLERNTRAIACHV